MPTKPYLGEFEQLVLLAVLQLHDEAYAPNVSRLLDERAGREVSRGALYATLYRLERKRYLNWKVQAATFRRRGSRRRLFTATPKGIEALARSRDTLMEMWRGLGAVLTRPTP